MQSNADAFFDLILKKEIDIDITNEFNIEEIQKAQLSLESRQTTGSVILNFKFFTLYSYIIKYYIIVNMELILSCLILDYL